MVKNLLFPFYIIEFTESEIYRIFIVIFLRLFLLEMLRIFLMVIELRYEL